MDYLNIDMLSFKNFILTESSLIPPKMYRVFSFNTYGDSSFEQCKQVDDIEKIVPKRFDQLEKRELLHVHGVSTSPSIVTDMGGQFRNAMIEMDSEVVLELNPGTYKIDYSNFQTLAANNFSLLRRVHNYKDWDKLTPSKPQDRQLTAKLMLHPFIVSEMKETWGHLSKNSENKDKATKLNDEIEADIVLLFQHEKFNTYEPIIKIILEHFKKNGIDISNIHPKDLEVKAEQWVKRNTHMSYHREEEWVTNPDRPFKIPPNSTLTVYLHHSITYVKESYKKYKSTGILDKSSILLVSDINKYIFSQKLSNLYIIKYAIL